MTNLRGYCDGNIMMTLLRSYCDYAPRELCCGSVPKEVFKDDLFTTKKLLKPRA